jgi:glycerophosphoryl diester phosphodiesterase
MSRDRTLLLGHRGARAVRAVPENTSASFDLALRHGADGFEFDVRGTADGHAVICHDPYCGGNEIARNSHDSFCELPLLEDVLARFSRTAFLDIELKVGVLEEPVLTSVKRHPPQAGYVVSSFLPEVFGKVRSLDTAVPLGFICDTQADFERWRQLPISHVIPHYKLLSKTLTTDIHSSGKEIFVWTVNQRDDMLRFRDWGVDAIISDDTKLLVRTLRPI